MELQRPFTIEKPKLQRPFTIVEDKGELERELYKFNRVRNMQRNPLVHVSIADIHFGAMDPEYQYNTLREQFTNVLVNTHFDLITIAGDTFDHKFMSNSDVVLYAMKFVDDLCNICRTRPNNPTIIILAGTLYHDSNQLKLFYNYLTDNTVDVRIVERARFEYVKGTKILCMPEEYGKGEEYYKNLLYYSGQYDMVVMHGTMENALPYVTKQESGIHSERAPIFGINHFDLCTGYMISGHIHTPMCLNKYFYYNGSPLRWRFGEEEEKGFWIFLFNPDTGMHHAQFIPIQSRVYKTLDITDRLNENAMTVIQNIKFYYENNEIDHLRIQIKSAESETELANLELIKKYFKNNNKIKVHIKRKNRQQHIVEDSESESNDEFKEYEFLLDDSYSPDEKLVMYINHEKGYEFITYEEYINLLTEKR